MQNRMITAIVFVSLMVSGCGSVSKSVRNEFEGDFRSKQPVSCDVRSYMADGARIKPSARYSIYIPSDRSGDLEYQHYVKLLGRFLNRHGWASAPTKDADYIVVMNFDIDGGRSEFRSYSTPMYGVISGGGVQHHSGTISSLSGGTVRYSGQTWTPPTYGQTGTKSVTQSHRVYTRHLVLDVINRSESERRKNSVVESTIKVRSEGSAGDIAAVMPFLMDSASDFLGREGSGTRTSDRIPYFSSSMDEANEAVDRVGVDDRDDLLIFGAQNGDLLTVRALLDKGVSPNTRGGKKNRPALHWAVYYKHAPVVWELLNRGATVDDRAIAYARESRQRDLEALLQSHRKQSTSSSSASGSP